MESPHAVMIETALLPINEGLARIVCGRHGEQISEGEILRILTLMACIRTRALEKGWEWESDGDLREIQSILRRRGV
jgi:hypothetical protein